MAEKRHLTVVGASATDDDAVPSRTASTWFVLGILLVVALWLPLGMLGIALSRGAMHLWAAWAGTSRDGIGPANPLWQSIGVLPIALAFAAAAYIGGMTVVRFGLPRNAGHGAWIGASGAWVVASLAVAGGTLRPWILGVVAYVALTLLGAVAGGLGGRRGQRLRKAANLSPQARSAAQPSQSATHRSESKQLPAPSGNEDS